MVNTGKPSRGCYMCRARRIKCDEGKPGCMRCQKSKRVCPGYRDAFELKLREDSKSSKKKPSRRNSPTFDPHARTLSLDLFCGSRIEPVEDFSNFTAQPVTALPIGHRRVRSESSMYANDFVPDFMGSQSAVQVHRNHIFLASHMATPVHQQAACYFLSNFVMLPKESTVRGYLDFILPLLQSQQSRPLLQAFSAAALAALATRPNSKALLPQADLWYVDALKEINGALKDPVIASKDSTLAAIMLLASFEQLVPSRMRVGGWTSHIDGAVALIKSRPKNTWNSVSFRDMFIAVRANMTIQCIANARGADPNIDWLSISMNDRIMDDIARINLKMAELRADNDKITPMALHTTENLEKVLKLVRRAESLEKEYVQWIEHLTPAWSIRTIAWIDPDIDNLTTSTVHPGKVVAFGELYMAYYFNCVRACRIYIWTTILRCVAWMNNPRDYRLSPEYSAASVACRQLIEDIVASVPYFFGWNGEKTTTTAYHSTFACGDSGDTSIRGLAGIFIMWPIFTAAASDFASPSQRIYLRGRLRFIAEEMGINQAQILLQAQFLHPSLYIARERANLGPSTRNAENTGFSFVEGALPSSDKHVSRPTLESGWIPRSFHRLPSPEEENPMTLSEEISQDITGLMVPHTVIDGFVPDNDIKASNIYEHELATLGLLA